MPNLLAMPLAGSLMKPPQQQEAAPQPQAAPSNFSFMPPKPQSNLLTSALDGFQRGFDPAGYQNRMNENKAQQSDDLKTQIATLQQVRALPAQQRLAILPQLSQAIGQDVPQSMLSDEEIDKQLALMMGQAGVAPEQPEYMNLGGGNVGKVAGGKFSMERTAPADPQKYTAYRPGDVVYGDKDGDGIVEEIFRIPDNDPAKTVNSQRITGDDGFVYSWNPQTNETKQVMGPNGKPLRAKESSGVTINMPGNVREGVGPDGRPVFVGIDPKNPEGGFQTIPGATPPSNMMSAETRSKFAALAPGAFAGIAKLKEMFGANQKEDPLEGVGGTAAAVASNVPFVGDAASRVIGGQKWQDFQQAWSAIELGVHIPAGAAVSPSEAMRFLRANQPGLYESRETKMRKIANVESFYQGLEAGYRGDWSMMERLIKSSTAAAAPESGSKAPALDAEEQAMVNQLRAAGYTQAQIDKIISGQ